MEALPFFSSLYYFKLNVSRLCTVHPTKCNIIRHHFVLSEFVLGFFAHMCYIVVYCILLSPNCHDPPNFM